MYDEQICKPRLCKESSVRDEFCSHTPTANFFMTVNIEVGGSGGPLKSFNFTFQSIAVWTS